MSDQMKIVCNWQSRPVLSWLDLTKNERSEFDYLDSEDKQHSAQFVRYRNLVYDISEFMRIDSSIAPHPQRPQWEKFNGYMSDSFFSGVLIKWCDDYESAILATFYS